MSRYVAVVHEGNLARLVEVPERIVQMLRHQRAPSVDVLVPTPEAAADLRSAILDPPRPTSRVVRVALEDLREVP